MIGEERARARVLRRRSRRRQNYTPAPISAPTRAIGATVQPGGHLASLGLGGETTPPIPSAQRAENGGMETAGAVLRGGAFEELVRLSLESTLPGVELGSGQLPEAHSQHGMSALLGVSVEPVRLFEATALTPDGRLHGHQIVDEESNHCRTARIFTQRIVDVIDVYPRAGSFMVRTVDGIVYACTCDRLDVMHRVQRLGYAA